MPPKPILICTVGLPRSGKSTWAREQDAPIVCPDSVRFALHGSVFAARAEPYVWAIAKTMVRALFISGHEIVILDATNNTRKRRLEWRDEDWRTVWRPFEAAVDVCIERARQTGREDIIPIIEKMGRDGEPLAGDELDSVWSR